jgi:putative heme iron utilization protein
MKLPFIDNKGFERLPGEKPSCSGAFKRAEIDTLLENKEKKVLGTAARFLQVSETEIVQVIPMSANVVGIVFAQKELDLYEYGDEDA